ncbi:MAG TPA: 4-alpha-glucanotransferase [Kiritimatiellia bacterium]|nr:4-alpha-glucanotransferase [Kiritimatiellia bacterium]
MNFPRASGVLLHPTSLPGPYGIGEIGPEAYRFADFLAETGQRLWQILPLGPTSYGDSPYQSPSTFAGNPLWVSFDVLIQDGLLKKEELADFPEFPAEKVDFGPVILARMEILETVCNQFAKRASKILKEQFNAFCTAQAEWLDDYALFAALKDAHGGVPWPQWGLELAQRQADALATAREKFAKEIRRAKIIQFLFENQWQRLRAYCRERNIQLIGDIPIFVAHDSADVWANPGLFFLGPDGQPSVVAGVPPDYFSATGQLWGNPLYNWPAHKQNNYDWWTARLRRTFELVDIVRIDHFRGFEAYWEIPGNETTAINGKWVPGPNADLFHVLHERLGELPIIAEDLGVITPPVEALRDQFGFPGMRILQFAFGNDDRSAEFRPESYPAHCCVYTGTHDNDTTVGWFHSEPGEGSTRTSEDIAAERKMILDYLRTDGREIHWDLINLGARSNGNTFVVPLQDLLGLDSSARMNTPGVASGNWQWRFTWEQLTPAIRDRFAHITRATGRRH